MFAIAIYSECLADGTLSISYLEKYVYNGKDSVATTFVTRNKEQVKKFNTWTEAAEYHTLASRPNCCVVDISTWVD